MNPTIFRQYDIRGIVETQFSVEECTDIARGIITYYLHNNPGLTSLIVGMDGRTHSPVIKEKVIQTAHEMGLDVVDIGVCPTPVFYFSVFTLPGASGIMITASHNPGQYNGFKLCLNRKTIWGGEIQTIRAIIENKKFAQPREPRGTTSYYNAISVYTDWLVDHFSHLKNMPLKVVVDCGNGTAGTVYPQLIEKFGWDDVTLMYEAVDGTFPNHEADPTVMENMRNVAQHLKNNDGYDLAIGLDGDCDRMAPMTHNGKLIAGDQLLALFSKEVLRDHPQATIVYDVKSSATLIDSLKIWGARGQISACGHAIIKEQMLLHDAKLAGELSCHFFFNDRYFGYDDGIYASLRLFELLLAHNTSLEKLVDALPHHVSSTELRLECKEENKEKVVNDVKNIFAQKEGVKVISIDGVRAHTDYGWGLLRASNTQPALSLRFESETQDGLTRIKNDFADILCKHFDEQQVRKHIERA